MELVEPANVIGRSTVESMQSGAVYGYTAVVDGVVERIRAEIGDADVVATGALAELMAPFVKSVQHVEPWLTLQGLRLIFEKNQPS